jgi:hypothetical protein
LSNQRPYFVRFQGKLRVVDAISQAQAIQHVTRPLVEDCHAATSREVTDFVRGGGTIEVAGVYPEPEQDEDRELIVIDVPEGTVVTDEDMARADKVIIGGLVVKDREAETDEEPAADAEKTDILGGEKDAAAGGKRRGKGGKDGTDT